MKLACNSELMQKVRPSKITLLALSLGLAFGFASGQMLHSQAETSTEAKAPAAAPEPGVSVRVHSGKTSSPQRHPDNTAINKLRSSASLFSLPSRMFDPWCNFDVLSSDLDHNWVFPVGMGAYIPQLDTIEQGDDIKITAEVPGIDENNLDVTVNEDSITIKGDKKGEVSQSKNDKSFHVIERSYGSFERTVSLPCKVQGEKAQAVLNNGVLTITVPKSQEPESQGRKLTIRRE